MNCKFKHMQLKIVAKQLASIQICERPPRGWINTIRRSLGMSLRQLANRVGVAQQSASRLESNEFNDSITLKSLRKVAEAMDCQLVYAIIPREGNLKDIIEKQALKKAKEIVEPVGHTMMLEGQSAGNVHERKRQMAREFVNSLDSKLWD